MIAHRTQRDRHAGEGYSTAMRFSTLSLAAAFILALVAAPAEAATQSSSSAARPASVSSKQASRSSEKASKKAAKKEKKAAKKSSKSAGRSSKQSSSVMGGTTVFPIGDGWPTSWSVVREDAMQSVASAQSGSPSFVRVEFPKGSYRGSATNQPDGGISIDATGGFPPSDRIILTYDIRLPKDFQYGRGGRLPCVFGGTAASPTALWCTLLWDKDGRLGVAGNFKNTLAVPTNLTWSPDVLPADGEWHTIVVEARMNSDASRANGLLRISLDGADILKTDKVLFRTKTSQLFEGLSFSAFYASTLGAAQDAAPADTFADFARISLKAK